MGTVDSSTTTAVDPAGLVVGDGWSLDWWIGADDRWHVPSREAAVRQDLIDDAPVIETRVKVPGGDAVHRAYGVCSPRTDGGRAWVMAEVENATRVPFAVALVIRPLLADAVGAIRRITVEPTGGGRGRDGAHLVRVDGAPAVVLPRRPARMATGSRATGDVAEPVMSGAAGIELVDASCPAGLATAAFVFPLAHTAVLRMALPVGAIEAGANPAGPLAIDGGPRLDYPKVVPDAITVASGWEVHRRGPRLDLPEPRLAQALVRARTHLPLAFDGRAVRRDGHLAPDLEPGATEVMLGAFDLLDRPNDVSSVVARWPERLSGPTPDVDALLLDVVARHWLLHREDALLDRVLPEVAAAVERLDRARRRDQLGEASARRARRAVAAIARMLAAAGQPEAGVAVGELARALGADPVALAAPVDPPAPAVPTRHGDDLDFVSHLLGLADRLAAGDPSAFAGVMAAVARFSATGAAPGPAGGGRSIGHDLAASAALVHVGRALLVAERPNALALLPAFPEAWFGNGVEAHDLPTEHGRLSFAVRWHGIRPALLWDLIPHPGAAAVTISAPGLDAQWSTTERRGDALLAEVAPPKGIDLVREVAEHPDIDPAMRRPGRGVDLPAHPLPEGGSFS